jgi:hypothetical protein
VVMLTVVNLAGEDSDSRTITVGTPTPTPTGSSAATPTPTATPAFNCFPPNVIGLSPGTAVADLNNAGFNPVLFDDLTNGQKDRIQSQNPDHTQCLAAGTTISIHYRPS